MAEVNAEACQEASRKHYQLCRHHLYWYNPSVAICYKCGEHGHFQASCPTLSKVHPPGQSGMCQAGVSYANVARIQPGQKQTVVSQLDMAGSQEVQATSSG